MKKFAELMEKAGDTAVFTFGRFNPPTIGHEKLIEVVAKQQSKNAGSKMYVYASHSEDPKKNPLPYTKKIAYMRKMFKKYAKNITTGTSRTAIEVAVELYKKGHKAIVMVVGSDRVQEFESLLNKYNGVDAKHGYYGFDNIEVVSAGERDPDAEGVSGMSASKMRKAAEDGDFQSFEMGLPTGFAQSKQLYRDVRKGMGIREERDMGDMSDREHLRDLYLTGKIWNSGDIIEAKGVTGSIVRKGTNYVSFADDDGKVHKCWIHEIELNERNYKKEYANYQGTPEQIARRSSRNKARRVMGDKTKIGMDVGHADNNPMNNDPTNLRNEDPSKNRREPRLREEEEVDERVSDFLPWLKKITSMSHPKGMKTLTKKFADLVWNDPKYKDKPNMAAFDVARQTTEVSPREFVRYINKLVDKGVLPKELKAEYEVKEVFSFKEFTQAIQEVKQDKDIDDKKGTQPAKYYAGDMAKSTKDKRDAHFKKKKSGPAPGDSDAKTKPSVHTKKFKQMFGEVLPDSATQKDYIDDFEKSDAPQFQGKSKEKRREMAIAAYLSKNEDFTHYPGQVDPKKDKKDGDWVKGDPEEPIDFDGSDTKSILDKANKEVEKERKVKVKPFVESFQLDEKIAGLVKKADKSGMPYSILKKVYDRGMAAWKTGHRPGTTPQQWAFARVNSFTTKSAGTWGKADKDLAKQVEQIV